MTSDSSGEPHKQEVPQGMVQAFSPSGGLDYLVPTSRILILESRDFGPRHTGLKYYNILDQEGNRILFAAENPGPPISYCCCLTTPNTSSLRNWSIEMYNHQGISIMSGSRITILNGWYSYSGSCQVSAFGQIIGGIHQKTDHFCCGKSVSSFTIVDGTERPLLLVGNLTHKMVGNCCCGRSSWNFPLMAPNGDPIGVITTFDTVDNFAKSKFGAEFPANLDVKIKALLIYATIMIDFFYFDRLPQSNS